MSTQQLCFWLFSRLTQHYCPVRLKVLRHLWSLFPFNSQTVPMPCRCLPRGLTLLLCQSVPNERHKQSRKTHCRRHGELAKGLD